EHIDREGVRRDVLRGRERVREEHRDQYRNEGALGREERRDHEHHHRAELEWDDPRAPRTVRVDERSQERLERPRRGKQRREPDRTEGHARLAHPDWQRLREEPERQSLRDVEEREHPEAAVHRETPFAAASSPSAICLTVDAAEPPGIASGARIASRNAPSTAASNPAAMRRASAVRAPSACSASRTSDSRSARSLSITRTYAARTSGSEIASLPSATQHATASGSAPRPIARCASIHACTRPRGDLARDASKRARTPPASRSISASRISCLVRK